MRIEAITRRKIVVELNNEDLEHLDITYDALDYASAETRRVIWVILDKVRESTGCDIDPSGQLLIDAMPRPTGGCILFFTVRGGCAEPFSMGCVPERVLRKQEQRLAAFEFTGADALLDCAHAYARALRSEEDRLFSGCELFVGAETGAYRLLVCPAQELDRLQQFFGEYARFCGENSFAAENTREHWQRVGGEIQFERLGGMEERALPKQRAAQGFAPGNVYV
jgi:hypothetical protein